MAWSLPWRGGWLSICDEGDPEACGKPAVDCYLVDPGDDPEPQHEDGLKIWLCAEHWDEYMKHIRKRDEETAEQAACSQKFADPDDL